MSAQQEGPIDDAARQEVMRELYVYRDMVEGFLMGDLNVERLDTAISALTLARGKMVQHGIQSLPSRW